MSVEISFPVEFVVEGTPVSLQTKRATRRLAWQDRVRQASYSALPDEHFATDSQIAVTILYFTAQPMQGDIDNIVKPILGALCRHLYVDDRQVERVWVQKIEPGRELAFRNPSARLTGALVRPRPILYFRIGDDPMEGGI